VTNRSDVILTADKNTFYPVTKKINDAYCVLVYPELFEHSEKYVLKYYDDKVDNFVKTPRKNHQPKEVKAMAVKPIIVAQKSVDTTKSQENNTGTNLRGAGSEP
jgi:hypothetical protein